jgi:hypothetical protein
VRVFALVLKQEPENENAGLNMRFLLSALLAMREANPIVESYLIQLDLEGVGMAALQENVISVDFGDLESGVVSSCL